MNQTLPFLFALALAACTGGGASTPTDSAVPEILHYGDAQCTIASSPPDGTEPTDEATLLALLAGPVLPERVVWDERVWDERVGLALESDIAWTITPTGPATRAELSGPTSFCGYGPMLRVPVTITFDVDQGDAWGAVDVFVYATGPEPTKLLSLGRGSGTLDVTPAIEDLIVEPLDPATTYEGTFVTFGEGRLVDPDFELRYAASYPDYDGIIWSVSGERPYPGSL